MDGVQLPQGLSHSEEAVYFLPLSSQKFLVLILSTSQGWKAESTLKPPGGFEHGTPKAFHDKIQQNLVQVVGHDRVNCMNKLPEY